MEAKQYDFCGYVTKNDLKCTDGRVIRKDAFKHNDGKRVPLVWQHLIEDPSNVLGYVDLQNREDGVYGRASFNDSEKAKQAKVLLAHGDLNSFSIHAGQLRQSGSDVLHGDIKEVSLVLAGANPGAKIDNLTFVHSDGTHEDMEDEAVISIGETGEVYHADSSEEDDDSGDLADVWNTLTEKQKNAVSTMIVEAFEMSGNKSVSQSGLDEGDGSMKKNVFDQTTGSETTEATLTHDAFKEIYSNAVENKMSLKQAFGDYALAHADEYPNGIPGVDYGVANLELLFPEYQNVRSTPDMIKQDDAWVSYVINGTSKTPFSRVKTMTVDITAEVARARGYKKGHLKKEEVIKFAKRVTNPTTIYKKQRLDRDDIIDASTMDIVSFLKSEMQAKLREELARAILISDGRAVDDEDKIDEDCIRPILKENEFYAYQYDISMAGADDNARYVGVADQVAMAMIDYRGSGSPTLFTTKRFHTKLRRVRDQLGRKLYDSDAALMDDMGGIGRIEEVPYMEGLELPNGKKVLGIIVNLTDYNIGTNRGGQTTFFDDFDIDFNQYKYLYETRLSGALTRPDSAVILVESEEPPIRLSVKPLDGSATPLGSVRVDTLQDKVVISSTNVVNGVLKYKKDYSEFSKSNPALNTGHFLALKLENVGTDEETQIDVYLTGNVGSKETKKLDTDGQLVVRVTDEMSQKLRVKVTGTNGVENYTYSLSGLRLEDEAKE